MMGDLSRSLLTGETDPTVQDHNPLEIPPSGQGISDVILGRNPDGRLRLSMDAAQAKNPDQQARVLALQARTGLPPDLIERNLDAVERQAARADFDAREFRRNSPIVADWLAENPQHAAVAQDDLGNLTLIERTVRAENREYQRDTTLGERLLNRATEGFLNLRQTLAVIPRLGAIERGAEAEQTGDFVIGFDPIGQPIYASQATIGQAQQDRLVDTAVDAGNAAARQLARDVAPLQARLANIPQRPATQALMRSQSIGEMFDALRIDPLGIMADIGISSAVQQLPALALTVATRNPAVAVIAAGGNSYALELGNGVLDYLGKQGVDVADPQAVVAALQDEATAEAAVRFGETRGAIVATLDAISAGLASKMLVPERLVSSQVGREVANTFVTQPLAQGALGATGEATAQLATEGRIRAPGEVFAEALGEFTQAPVEAGAFALDRIRSRRVVGDSQRAVNAKQDAERLQRIAEAAEASKLRERAPELFEQLVRNMAGEDARTVYAPVEAWDTLFQDGAIEAARDLLGDEAAYREAKATGGDIAIPVEVYASRIAPTEANAALLPELRFDPDGMSLREAEEWEARREEIIGETMAALGEEGRPVDDTSGQVYEDVLGQLLGSGVERGAAEKQAVLVQSVFRTLGARTGMDPLALYERYGLEVRREIPEALRPFAEVDTSLDPLIDRLRAGDIPSQQDIFGESLTDFLRAAGGIQDQGGELSVMDAQLERGRVGQRRLVSPDGRTLDEAAELAAEAGFIPERDINALLEAIDEEIRGNPVYRPGSENAGLLETRQALLALDEELNRAGIDVAKVSNDTIKAFLSGEVDEELVAARMATDPDGITYDQAGRLQTDTEAFRRWFGDSKVVDENGEPLVVYHGTTGDFDVFDMSRAGQVGDRFAEAAFFTSDPVVAGSYAARWMNSEDFRDARDAEDKALNAWGKAVLKFGRHSPEGKRAEVEKNARAEVRRTIADEIDTMQRPSDGASVVPAYLSITNPLEVDGKGQNYFTVYAEAFADAQAGGHDGLIFRNVVDSGNVVGSRPSDVFVAFRPEQIKSATGNRGTFDPSDPSILNQGEAPGLLRRFFQSLVDAIAPPPVITGEAFLVDGKPVTANPDTPRGVAIRSLAAPSRFPLDLVLDTFEQAGQQEFAEQVRAEVEDLRGRVELRQEADTTLFQGEGGPTFTSALTGAVSALQQPKATPDQWAGIIRNLTNKGVKQEEIEFSGVLDWLAEQEGSVAREDLVAFLQANELQVEEVVKGGAGQRTIRDPAIAADVALIEAAGLTAEINPEDQAMVAFMDPEAGDFILSGDMEQYVEESGVDADPQALSAAARRVERYIGSVDDLGSSAARFGTYQLPGGKNYREVLLTLPPNSSVGGYIVAVDGLRPPDAAVFATEAEAKAEARRMVESNPRLARRWKVVPNDKGQKDINFRSTHFDEPNILAHVRFNERTDAEGRRVLFIEEIQSDWHQQGRKGGYRRPISDADLARFTVEDSGGSAWNVYDGAGVLLASPPKSLNPTAEEALEVVRGAARKGTLYLDAVPDAPLKTDWPLFVVKRMIRWAAENGFDRVAWTPGEVQADRYDLSKQVEAIRVMTASKDGMVHVMVRRNGGSEFERLGATSAVERDKLSDVIGKDAAEKALERLDTGEDPVELSGLDLKVGGEGMRGFYDKMLPRMVGKYIKRFGSKVETTEVPIARSFGLRFTDGPNTGELFREDGDTMAQPVSFKTREEAEAALREEGLPGEVAEIPAETVESWSFAVTPEMRAAAMSGQALFQDRPGSRGGKRGMIQFDPARQRFRVTLLQRADLSTFLHESGHFYLEVLGDLVERGDADPQLQADYRTLLGWMGAADRAGIGTEQHEQFARGFEAYLMEGRAPSPDLQGVFARFRAWLIGVYRALKNLNVELTDEVRGVFDRLVATDAEIAAAEEAQNYQPLFEDAQAAGMSDEEFEAYRAAIEAARAEATEDVTRQAMNEITRETRAWWNERRAEVRREVEGEVNRRPVYMAMFFLQRGSLPDGSPLPEGVRPMKLSKQALVDAYGEPFLRRLPRPYVYTREGGVHPDTVAPLFGFRSGDELVQALVNARPRVQVIEAETDERMREQYGDIRTDGSLPEKALAAVHNEKRAQVMVREMRLLHARANLPARAAPLPTVAKAAAQRIIGQRRVRDIQPHTYRVAEAKAARQAFDAVAAGDFLAAAEAKRRQLLNHELYRQARDAREQVDKAVGYLRGFDKKATRERIGKAGADYLEQIDAILDRFDLSPISNRALDRRQALAAWVERQEAAGFQVDLPEALLNEARRVSWRELPLEELLGVRDAVRNIEHLAKLKNRLLANKKHRDLEAAVDDIVGAIEREHGPVGPEPPNFAPGLKDRLGDAFSRFDAAHTKMEFLFRYLDGGEVGPVWEALFQPLAAAESAEQVMMREATERLREIFGTYSRKERALMHLTRIHVPEVDQSFTRASLLAVALNWGNAYNRDVLMRGYGWDEGQVEAILSRLTAKDWDVVEAIWTFIDGYWPQIEAIQRDLTGLPPEKVEAEPFTLTVGGQRRELRGGYYPIKYDAGLSFRQQQLEERAQTRELYGNNWLRPATRKGHTKERTDSGGKPVLLDLGVLTQHVTNVVHDLTHRRAILDIDRLIQHPRVAAAIEGAAGRAMHRELRPWLQAIANDIREPAGPFERILGHARMGATVVNMGWKITTAIVQPLGYLQSVDVLGEKYAWIGLQKFYGRVPYLGQRETVKWVMEQSEMMRNRQRTFDRDVRDALKGMTLSGQAAEVQRSFFYLTGLMDMSVAVPTWLGAYQKAMDGAVENVEAGDRPRAIDYADSVVRTTQSAGGAKDLARIQRGSEYHRIFTMFYSYFSVLYNLFKRRFQITRGISDVPRFAASMFYLWFVPAVLSELVAGRGPDDEDEWPAWAAGKLIAYPFQTVVGLRDLVNAMGPYGYEASPAFDAFEQTVRAVKAAGEAAFTDEEFEESDARAAALAAGYWAVLPARQMWITGSYLYDWMTGEEDPESFGEVLRGLAFARPPE